MTPKIFLHEDFYRQIELVPEENYFAANKSIEELPGANDSPYGFTHCIIRGQPPVPLLKRKITFQEISEYLSHGACLFSDNVQMGYSNTSYNIDGAYCWGFEHNGIFVECDRAKVVISIWVCESFLFEKDNLGKKLFEKLYFLGKNYGLILIDWNKELAVRMTDAKFLRNYLNDELGFEVPEQVLES